ncbi:hypothetical protein [Mycolicibacterium stellerae]|uniref:hypothetical protein n=1 Tax=Mycolicibacterium stellerae TaxID=2358193 RepID=UPI0013DE7500|nr:hypothetical protein [Mycolicibacterium stellerae]
MGRVNRLSERRALRRAADQALLTTLGNPTHSDAGGRPDQDFKYNRAAEPVETTAPHDHEPTTDPIPVIGDPAPDDHGRLDEQGWPDEDAPQAESTAIPSVPIDVYDLVPDSPDAPRWEDAVEVAAAEPAVTEAVDDYAWDTPAEAPAPGPAPVRPPLRARPVAEGAYVQPALDFAATVSRPWYRTKPAAVVLSAAIIAALVCAGWLVFRSPDTTAEESTEAPTSAPSASSTAASTTASRPRPIPAPPPPPPPPPPPEPTYSAPQRQYSPRYSEPTPAQKPRIDVTRAPMSVAPVPRPVPGSDSGSPGEQPRRRGCFGYC